MGFKTGALVSKGGEKVPAACSGGFAILRRSGDFSEKGKPVERRGRKATGPVPVIVSGSVSRATDTTPTTANAEVASTITLSTTVPVTVHTQATSSVEGGDALTASYSLVMPFVDADTCSGGLTFTAAAN